MASDAEIDARMQSNAWIRECCTKLIKFNARIRDTKDAKQLMRHLREFFRDGWANNDELNVSACLSTFYHTCHFVREVLDQKIARADVFDAGMAAFGKDLEETVYRTWIPRLCAAMPPSTPFGSFTKNARWSLVVPTPSWHILYTRDPLIRDLETVYLKFVHMGPDTTLVRLNGEHELLH